MGEFSDKEIKAIFKAFVGTDIDTVKKFLNNGVDPNTVLTSGNVYDGDNTGSPYTPYDIVLLTQVRLLEYAAAGRKLRKQKRSLEIVKLVTPLVKSAWPCDEDAGSYTMRNLPFRGIDLGRRLNKYKRLGMYDELIEAMLQAGYDFAGDKDMFWTIGLFGLETAKRVLAITGLDDGASLFSAVDNGNTGLAMYLLDAGVSPNKPFRFSSGGATTALHKAISSRNIPLVDALLDAGADTSVKDQYGQDCLEWAVTSGVGLEDSRAGGKLNKTELRYGTFFQTAKAARFQLYTPLLRPRSRGARGA